MPRLNPHLKLGPATLVNALGIVIPGLVTILTIPVFIRTIGDERYGILAIVWLLIGYFSMFDLGFGRALTHRLGELPPSPPDSPRTAFWTATGLSLLAGLLGGLLLFGVADLWLQSNVSLSPALKRETQDALPWVLLALPLATTLSVLSGALTGYGAFVPLNLGQIIGSLMFQLLPLGVALWHSPSLGALIPAALIGRASSLLILTESCRKVLQLHEMPKFSKMEASLLLRYGGWVTVTALAGPLLTVVDRFIIGFLNGAAAVTAYTVPFNLVGTALMIFPTSLQKAITPVMTQGDRAMIQQQSKRYLLGILALMTPVVVLATLLITPFLEHWVGPALTQRAGPVGILLLLGNWINALALIPFTGLQCQGRPDIPARFHLWELAPYGMLLWWLTAQYGVGGAALAWDVRVLVDAFLLFQAANLMSALRAGMAGAAVVVSSLMLALFMPYRSLAYVVLGTSLLLISLFTAWKCLPVDWRHKIPLL